MAIMCPDKVKDFEKNSLEDIMFDALQSLPDSYYVFHSFKMVNVNKDNIIYESEADFVIFNPQKGILCIEAKAGNVNYTNGKWYYGSGKLINHDGPYRQAESIKWKLSKYFEDKNFRNILNNCKLLHAVWFPSITKSAFNGVNLPPEADLKITLTNEALENIETEIEKIFSIQLPNHLETRLDSMQEDIIINKILAPSFDLVSIPKVKLNNTKHVFTKMLNEQIALLNYLEEQDNAIISGMAGTGKTVMAMEKAKRHATNGEKVLVLCYNSKLRDFLKEQYHNNYIDIFNIDEFACYMCTLQYSDYELLANKLLETIDEDSFPYKHIIIDEGQDFGREEIVENEIVELLKSNVLNENKNGTFYFFYDKNQMIQSKFIPKYITESDCKLTLYHNCRNTFNIAQTSLKLLKSEQKPKVLNNYVLGENVELYIKENETDTCNTLNTIIDEYRKAGYESIQILTCSTLNNSIITNYISNEKYKNIPITTCRKFKGLEADAIILIDINMDIFDNNEFQIMYVGASRAKYKLSLLANLSEKDCSEILISLGEKIPNHPQKRLSAILNTKLK